MPEEKKRKSLLDEVEDLTVKRQEKKGKKEAKGDLDLDFWS